MATPQNIINQPMGVFLRTPNFSQKKKVVLDNAMEGNKWL